MKLPVSSVAGLAGLVSLASADGFHKVCRQHSTGQHSSAAASVGGAEQYDAASSSVSASASASVSGSAPVEAVETAASSADVSAAVPEASGSVNTDATVETRATSNSSSDRLVFAHFMLVADPLDGDYKTEMKLAQSFGVDAFAVNYGGWDVDFDDQDSRLAKMYKAAEETDFKLFLSLDMTSVTEASMVVDVAKAHASSNAQLYYNDQLFLSTFIDGKVDSVGFDWQSDVIEKLESDLGKEVFFVPGTTSTDYESCYDDKAVDGVFSWPHQSTKLSEDKKNDEGFEDTASYTNKAYMAGIAPWFFKHYSSDMNWGNRQDSDIFVTRFQNLLKMDVDFIELVTWNDYGESSYFAEADVDKKNTQWSYLDHTGFREMAKFFIAAFKEDQQDVMKASNIENSVFMFYRTQPYDSQGSNDDLGPPSDADEEDSIFVVSFLQDEADITLSNGGEDTTWTAQTGLNMKAVPFKAGSVHLKATVKGDTIADKDGPEIANQLELTNENAVCI